MVLWNFYKTTKVLILTKRKYRPVVQVVRKWCTLSQMQIEACWQCWGAHGLHSQKQRQIKCSCGWMEKSYERWRDNFKKNHSYDKKNRKTSIRIKRLWKLLKVKKPKTVNPIIKILDQSQCIVLFTVKRKREWREKSKLKGPPLMKLQPNSKKNFLQRLSYLSD